MSCPPLVVSDIRTIWSFPRMASALSTWLLLTISDREMASFSILGDLPWPRLWGRISWSSGNWEGSSRATSRRKAVRSCTLRILIFPLSHRASRWARASSLSSARSRTVRRWSPGAPDAALATIPSASARASSSVVRAVSERPGWPGGRDKVASKLGLLLDLQPGRVIASRQQAKNRMARILVVKDTGCSAGCEGWGDSTTTSVGRRVPSAVARRSGSLPSRMTRLRGESGHDDRWRVDLSAQDVCQASPALSTFLRSRNDRFTGGALSGNLHDGPVREESALQILFASGPGGQQFVLLSFLPGPCPPW